MRTGHSLATEVLIGVGVWLAIPSLISLLLILIAAADGIIVFKVLVIAAVSGFI